MLDDDEEAVEIGDGPEPVYESLKDVRFMPSGRAYRVPDPDRRVIDLEEDCGVEKKEFTAISQAVETQLPIAEVAVQLIG